MFVPCSMPCSMFHVPGSRFHDRVIGSARTYYSVHVLYILLTTKIVTASQNAGLFLNGNSQRRPPYIPYLQLLFNRNYGWGVVSVPQKSRLAKFRLRIVLNFFEYEYFSQFFFHRIIQIIPARSNGNKSKQTGLYTG